MVCGGIDPGNIYMWAVITGVLAGGSLSFIIAPRARRSTGTFLIILSTAVFSGLGAFAFSGFGDFSTELIIWLAAASALGFCGFLFWKFIGIPLFFILVISISIIWYSLYSWSCVVPDTQICSFRIVSEGSGYVRIQYQESGGQSITVKADAGNQLPEIEIIHTPEWFFIVKARGLYRFNDFSAEAEADQEGLVLNNLLRVPGFRYRKAAFEGENIFPSIDYQCVFNSSGDPEINRKIE